MKRKDFLKLSSAAAGLSLLPEALTAREAAPAARRSLRFAYLTDIHVKPGEVPEKGMAKALQHVQKLRPEVDFIINGGDSIMDALAATAESTQTQWDLFNKILKQENNLPVYPCIGNHDVYGWFQKNPDTSNPLYGKAWAVKALQMPERYYHFNKGKWDFIVLDSTQLNPAGGYIGKIDNEQLVWLKNKLAEIPSDHYISIISHIPILSICSGLFFNKNEPNGDLKIQRNLMHTDFLELKKLFRQYPNLKSCLSGHIHLQDELRYLDISYYCNGAVSGAWWKGAYQEFQPAYAVFEYFNDGTCTREMVPY